MIFEYALAFTLLTIYTMLLHFWSDLKELKVDSRRNHMMIGAVIVIGIISHEITTLIIAGVVTIAITYLLGVMEEKQKRVVFGDGDKEILAWSIPGIALVFGFYYSALFVGLLMVSFFILAFARHKLLINEQKFPGLIILCLIYIIVLILGWLL